MTEEKKVDLKRARIEATHLDKVHDSFHDAVKKLKALLSDDVVSKMNGLSGESREHLVSLKFAVEELGRSNISCASEISSIQRRLRILDDYEDV